MNRLEKYLHISEKATAPNKHWSNIDLLKFEYFNPNGAHALKMKLNDAICDAVDANIVKCGWHVAYGFLNDYHTSMIRELAMKKRATDFEARYYGDAIRRQYIQVMAMLEAETINHNQKEIAA